MERNIIARGRDESWRLDYLFSIAPGSWLIHIGVVALVYMVLRDPGLSWPGYWFAGIAFWSAAAFALGMVYGPFTRDRPQLKPAFGWLHTFVTGCVGIMWGGGAIMAAGNNTEEFLFYTLSLGGTGLGAASSQHSLPRSFLVSISTSVSGLAYAHYLHAPGTNGLGAAALMTLFGGMLTVITFRMHRFLQNNRALATELDSKVEELTRLTSDLTIARQSAEEANAAKSRLLAQASHDLRQPVHAVGLLVESLRQRMRDPDGLHVLDRIDGSLASLSRLFRSLLDISALDVGKVRPEYSTFSIGAVIEEVCRQNAELAERHGVTIRPVSTSLWVRSDPALVHTMLQNLVSNAVKYAPGAHVLVGCRRRGRDVDIEVYDTGPGISEADLPRAFQEFVRLERRSGRPKAQEGMGLGLSIVQRLAALLGLTVDARSRLGHGSCFIIRGLARVASRPVSSRPQPASPGAPTLLQGLRLLVVDDDESAREAMADVLSRWNCSAAVYETPPADAAGYDVILMDHELADGKEGLSEILRLRELAGRPIPAALITGTSDPGLADRAAEAGVVMLRKPARAAQIRSVLLTAASGLNV